MSATPTTGEWADLAAAVRTLYADLGAAEDTSGPIVPLTDPHATESNAGRVRDLVARTHGSDEAGAAMHAALGTAGGASFTTNRQGSRQ